MARILETVNRGWTIYVRCPLLGRIILASMAGIVVFGAISSALTLVSPVEAQTIPITPSINGNCNAFGNNNSNCSTYYIGPQKLRLTDSIKSLLLSNIPKDKPGIVDIIGPSQEDQLVGHQILDFL
jgi:hypothetical protein